MLSDAQLRAIMPRLHPDKLPVLLPPLNSAMAEYDIDSAPRVAAFIAQVAHESGEFRWMEEIWGPTDAQRRYEPPSALATRLGNTQPGDGVRFKGRGPIQLTGRANYQRFGQLLGVDLVGAPESAAAPQVAFRIAALYWANRGLNALADAGDFREITRRINGGFNGLPDRTKYFERAKTALAEFVSKALPRGLTEQAKVPDEELDRGVEAVREFAAPAQPRPRKATRTSTRAKSPKARAKATRKAKATKRRVAPKSAPARLAAARKTVAKKKSAKKKSASTRKRAAPRKRTRVAAKKRSRARR